MSLKQVVIRETVTVHSKKKSRWTKRSSCTPWSSYSFVSRWDGSRWRPCLDPGKISGVGRVSQKHTRE